MFSRIDFDAINHAIDEGYAMIARGKRMSKSRPTLNAIQIDCEARRKIKDATMTNSHFIRACELAKIEPTRRQASKFLEGRGAAYRALNRKSV